MKKNKINIYLQDIIHISMRKEMTVYIIIHENNINILIDFSIIFYYHTDVKK
jgi:hypothetical protein